MQTEVSTNTNLVVFNTEGIMRDMRELIPLYAKAGIRHLDLNFCEMLNPGSPLNEEEKSAEYIGKLMNLKEEYGLTFVQSHAPYPARGMVMDENMKSMILKSMHYSEVLGVDHIVIHPEGKSIEGNVELFEELLDRYDGNITIALENMESKDEIYHSSELLEIISHFPGRMGICFDIGHANVTHLDIPKEIEAYGENLIGTHIADNDGNGDQHLLPWMGNIDWKKAMDAFRKYYRGYINYEAMFYSRTKSIREENEVIELAIELHRRLISL